MTGSLEKKTPQAVYPVFRSDRVAHPVFGGVTPDRNPLDSVEEFEGFISTAYGVVFRLAQRKGCDNDESADVTQETMLRIWKKWIRSENSNIWTLNYAVTVANNIIRDDWRKKRPVLEDGSTLEKIKNVVRTDQLEDLDPSARRAIEALTPKQRRVVELTVFEGLSSAEASNVLQVSSQTVYNYRRAAFKKLAELLSEDSG